MKHTTCLHVSHSTLFSYMKHDTSIPAQLSAREVKRIPGLSSLNADLYIHRAKNNGHYSIQSKERSDGGIFVWNAWNINTTHLDFVLFLNPKNPNYKDRPYSINMFHVAQVLLKYQAMEGSLKTTGSSLANKIIEEKYGTYSNLTKDFKLAFNASTLFSFKAT